MLFQFKRQCLSLISLILSWLIKVELDAGRQDKRTNPNREITALKYPCNMLTVTMINNNFLDNEFYTFSSNGIHLITLFSGCCLASGFSDCWVLSLYLASRSPVNLKITEPEEHINGCWNEHLFRQPLNFLPLRNFPGALHETHRSTYSLLPTLSLHEGSSHKCLHPVADSKWSREGSSSHLNCFEDHLT